ncbi:ATP-binding protein [Streptomyces sp. NPDC093094]|uniref:ATP-binding protein n=1 Tax=Streptomyces sp. NPDC093094 TaxID=3366026 RepID=UPI0037FFBC44
MPARSQACAPGPWRVSAAFGDGGAGLTEARRLAAGFLTGLHTGHGVAVSARAVELTQLVVSELVTNARKYAPGPVLLELSVTNATVEVTVCDSNPVLPVVQAADPTRVGQHGLEIVTAVAEELQVHREPVGKRITARLALQDDSGDAAGSRCRV